MTFVSAPIAIGTADTLIYECPATLEGSVHGLQFENYSGGTIAVTIKLFKFATGVTSTVRSKNLAAGEEYEFAKINVTAGDKVLASAGTAGTIRALANAYVDAAVPIEVGFTPRGAWLIGSNYAVNNVVEFDGSSYIARAANIGSQPPSANWMLNAQKGAQGPAGSGAGDMVTATYDPTGKGADAFNMENMDEGATKKILLAAERIKLAAIATGATANATDAQLRDRSTHTGTQSVTTITGLGTAATLNTGTGAGNIPLLDGSGLLNASILPAIAVTDVFEVASQAAMLALTAQVGDIAIRTDLNKTFALGASPATTLANWKELRTPTDTVLAVAGLTGTVTATALKSALAIAVADITDASANGRSLMSAANYGAMKTLLAITAADITNASANGRALLSAADYAAMRVLLDLEVGVDIQAYDTDTAKTDVAQNFTASQWTAPVALASASSLAFTLAGGNSRTLTLGTNATLPNPSDIATYVGMKGSIACVQDATGGRTLSFGNLWFPIDAVAAPAAPTAANAKFRIDYEVVSSTRIDFQLSKVGVA
jgi:preprotein translocase subunit YajC